MEGHSSNLRWLQGKPMTKNIQLFVFSLLLAGCAVTSHASASTFKPCYEDKPRLELRSIELSKIVKADQDDREDFFDKTPEEMQKILKRDEQRRQRVGEIFGEGCFSKAHDFAAAALVYQHGNVPEHFLQAFMWAKRAMELGDASQKRLMALAIDRYLVNIGHKQLFGSQASKPGMTPKTCWCLEQVEASFPDKLRSDIAGKSLKEAFDWLDDLNKGLNCPKAECLKNLKDTPVGTLPGFW